MELEQTKQWNMVLFWIFSFAIQILFLTLEFHMLKVGKFLRIKQHWV